MVVVKMTVIAWLVEMMGTNKVLQVHSDDDGNGDDDGKRWSDVKVLIIMEVEQKIDR